MPGRKRVTKFDRCLRDVKRKGVRSPGAVCQKSVGRGNPSDAYKAGFAALRAGEQRHGTVNLSPSIAQREDWAHAWREFMAGWNAAKKRGNKGHRPRTKKKVAKRNPAKRNPEALAAEAYRDFHGKEPAKVITVDTPRHYHGVLAGIGKARLRDLPQAGRTGQRDQVHGRNVPGRKRETNPAFHYGR